jgi:hypothetical protein
MSQVIGYSRELPQPGTLAAHSGEKTMLEFKITATVRSRLKNKVTVWIALDDVTLENGACASANCCAG